MVAFHPPIHRPKSLPPHVFASDTVKGGKPPSELGTPTKANVPRLLSEVKAAQGWMSEGFIGKT